MTSQPGYQNLATFLLSDKIQLQLSFKFLKSLSDKSRS